jgi:hypothetical protein
LWFIDVRRVSVVAADDALQEYIERDLFNELRWLLCAATEWDAEEARECRVKQPCFHVGV